MSQPKKQKKNAPGRKHKNAPSPKKHLFDIEQALTNAIKNHQAGNLHQAEKIYSEILTLNPNHAETLHAYAIMACQRGQHATAVTLFQKAIHESPATATYHYNLGSALKDMERLDEAATCYLQALRLKPDYLEALNNLGIVFHRQGKFNEALSVYQKVLQLNPEHAEALYNLANTLQSQGRTPEAIVYYQKSLAAKENFPEVYTQLGNIFHEQGKPDAAIGCFQYALQIDPMSADGHFNLAKALMEQGKHKEAIISYQKVIELEPNSTSAYNNLGYIFKYSGQLTEAEACLRRALEIMPAFAAASTLNNLGTVLQDQGRLFEAETSMRRALEITPTYAEAYNNLGNVQSEQGRLSDAAASYGRALELMPDYAEAYSNLLFCLTHNARVTPETLFSEHCRFGEQFETPFRANYPQHTKSRDPERSLRVGFVSGDLRNHAVAYFIEPVLTYLSNYSQLSLHAYANHVIEDAVTQRMREHFVHWHSIVGLSDTVLAEKIRADGIDILVDLSGHSAKNRLLTFAQKPAPIQASWIGYPGTTGLSAMDYYLADRFLLPPGQLDDQFTEKIVRLPANAPFLPSNNAPPINTLPALSNGYVTFGSFNRPSKLNPSVISLWSQLLRALPDSRIVLGDIPQDENMDTLIDLFARERIVRHRLSFHPRCNMDSYLKLHHHVDICLDTFPYNGGTTTCHALWMGIPTLTLAGDTLPGRVGAAILGHVGLGDFIAQNKDDFVQKGLLWAGNLTALSDIRTGLRDRFAQSAMGQPEVVAAGLERALRIMWQRWCAGLPAASFGVSNIDNL